MYVLYMSLKGAAKIPMSISSKLILNLKTLVWNPTNLTLVFLHSSPPGDEVCSELPLPAGPNLGQTAEGGQIWNAVYNLSCCTRWAEQTQASHMPGATFLRGWHRLTLRYFPGVCPQMMRLSLLCMCQMNHKPIPYAIAICWWAQAVLVDIKSRDYGGLILSEWGEKRTGRWWEWRGERWRLVLAPRFPIGPLQKR